MSADEDPVRQGASIAKRLSMAAFALVAIGNNAAAQDSAPRVNKQWEVDTSYLSYTESDDRVSVSKALANLSWRGEQSTAEVNLINDTMSGASPTGAIRSSNSAVTYTGASGAASIAGNDYSKSTFDDHRQQAGFNYEREHSRSVSMSYGGAVSSESDFDSYGANAAISRSTMDQLKTYRLGIAYTQDTIYRSDTGGTPEPLSNMQNERMLTEGERTTVETLLGFTRILNKRTVAQINLTLGQSEGYHSDPYKVISAADDNDRILANFHDSRPDSRLRMALFGKMVHQLQGTDDTLNSSYRFYVDDWGVNSHTAELSYRKTISDRHYIEPHLRFYHQSDADFYQRKLDVDDGFNPMLPDNGYASADYRLDRMGSATIGIKYGLTLTPYTRLRIRAAYLDQQFSTSDYGTMSAVILQTSFSYSF